MSPERFHQIEELYHAAREASAVERAALLAQTDPELRRQVELLLSDPSGCEFLDRPAIQNAPELLAGSTVTGFGPDSGAPSRVTSCRPAAAFTGSTRYPTTIKSLSEKRGQARILTCLSPLFG